MKNRGAMSSIGIIAVAVIFMIVLASWLYMRIPLSQNTSATSQSENQTDNINQDENNNSSDIIHGNNSTPAQEKTQVFIQNFSFSPKTITIKAGTTVTWINQDTTAHTVSSSFFDSGNIAPDGTFEHSFQNPGTINYHCKLHPSMTGKIIVEK